MIVQENMDNSLRLRKKENSLILDLIGDKVNPIEFDVYLAHMKKLKEFEKIYINIANLGSIDNELLNKFHKMRIFLKDRHVCFINVNVMQNSVLNLFGIDKLFQLYMNKADAVEGRKPIINRKFKIVS